MRLFFLVVFAAISTLAAAQVADDYLFFRPDSQYLYVNPLLNPNAQFDSYVGILTRTGRDTQELYWTVEPYDPATYDYRSCLRREPSIAGYNITELNGRTLMRFDEDSLLLLRTLPVGARWAASPTVDAQVTEVSFGTVLEDLQDSLKTIRLTDRGGVAAVDVNIIVSKRNGLVQATVFHDLSQRGVPFNLAGYGTRGVQNPDVTSVTNMSPGDRLAVERGRSGSSQEGDYWYIFKQQDIRVDSVRDSTLTGGIQARVIHYTMDELEFLADDFRPFEGTRDSVLRRDVYGRFILSYDHYFLQKNGRPSQPGEMVESFGRPQVVTLSERGPLTAKSAGDWYFTEGDSCFRPGIDGTYPGPFYDCLGTEWNSHSQSSLNSNHVVAARTACYDFGELYDFSDITISTRNRRAASTDFQLWPNPATDEVRVRVDAAEGAHWVRLHDLAGREVTRLASGNGPRSLPVAGLPAGVYVVSIGRGVETLGRRRLILR